MNKMSFHLQDKDFPFERVETFSLTIKDGKMDQVTYYSDYHNEEITAHISYFELLMIPSNKG